MVTIFGLFERYDDARAAVEELLNRGFEQKKMNAMAQDHVAKAHMDVKWDKVKVDVTDRVGEKTICGLDELFGREEPVLIRDVGSIYAAGELATIMADAASRPEVSRGGLEEALIDFGVPRERAKVYITGMKQSGIVFWIRTSDERAPEAAGILLEHKAVNITSVM